MYNSLSLRGSIGPVRYAWPGQRRGWVVGCQAGWLNGWIRWMVGWRFDGSVIGWLVCVVG